MSFCKKCGEEIEEGVCFCPKCGEPTENNRSERKQEYAGKVKKCPVCGMELNSFVAICPGCGHEIVEGGISNSLAEFENKINECDHEIANNPEKPKTGWNTWDSDKKKLWVVVNIFTFAVPMMIYLIIPLLINNKKPQLTSAEKRKASIIENYIFPNERESIIEGLMFINTKMEFLLSNRTNRYTQFWSDLWTTKAEQLYQKAEILMQGDKLTKDAYESIINKSKKAHKDIKVILIIECVITLVLLCSFLFSFSSIKNKIMGHPFNVTEEHTELEWPSRGICKVLPKPKTTRGKIGFNLDDTFDADIYVESISDFDTYINDCKDAGFTEGVDEGTNSFSAYNEDGYKLSLSYYELTKEKRINIMLDAPVEKKDIDWSRLRMGKLIPEPKSKIGEASIDSEIQLYVSIIETTREDYEEYVKKCKDAGFNVDYNESDNYYEADNEDGDSLRIDFEGNDTMSISMYAKD